MARTTRTSKALGLAAVIALAAAACTGSSNASPRDPPSTSAAHTSPAASPSPVGASAAVLAAFAGYVATVTTMSNKALVSKSWDQYAGGDAYTQGVSTVTGLRQHGYVMSGKPVASQIQVIALDASAAPPTAQLTACWDTSKFVTASAATSRPVGGAFTTVLRVDVSEQENNGTWRVITFADSGSTC